jgi:hypothetical protein
VHSTSCQVVWANHAQLLAAPQCRLRESSDSRMLDGSQLLLQSWVHFCLALTQNQWDSEMNYFPSSHSPGNPPKISKNTSFQKKLNYFSVTKKKLYHYKVISGKFWIQFPATAKVRSALMFWDTWQTMQIMSVTTPITQTIWLQDSSWITWKAQLCAPPTTYFVSSWLF